MGLLSFLLPSLYNVKEMHATLQALTDSERERCAERDRIMEERIQAYCNRKGIERSDFWEYVPVYDEFN
jgi:hypothetical protein